MVPQFPREFSDWGAGEGKGHLSGRAPAPVRLPGRNGLRNHSQVRARVAPLFQHAHSGSRLAQRISADLMVALRPGDGGPALGAVDALRDLVVLTIGLQAGMAGLKLRLDSVPVVLLLRAVARIDCYSHVLSPCEGSCSDAAMAASYLFRTTAARLATRASTINSFSASDRSVRGSPTRRGSGLRYRSLLRVSSVCWSPIRGRSAQEAKVENCLAGTSPALLCLPRMPATCRGNQHPTILAPHRGKPLAIRPAGGDTMPQRPQ